MDEKAASQLCKKSENQRQNKTDPGVKFTSPVSLERKLSVVTVQPLRLHPQSRSLSDTELTDTYSESTGEADNRRKQ